MKIDLTKNGLESIFTRWEVKTLEILAGGGEYTSGTLVAKLNTAMEGKGVSQASIINLLEELTNNGITTKRIGTGKGGWRGIYKSNHTKESLREYIVELAENWAKNMRNPSSTEKVKGESNE